MKTMMAILTVMMAYNDGTDVSGTDDYDYVGDAAAAAASVGDTSAASVADASVANSVAGASVANSVADASVANSVAATVASVADASADDHSI